MSVCDSYHIQYPSQSGLYSSDSDLDPPQFLSRITSPNDTDNDSPPETPNRSLLLNAPSFSLYPNTKDVTAFKAVHMAEPLIVANPHPVRPILHSFHPFTHQHVAKDVGYDSEHECLVRPPLPRFRSHRRTPDVAKSSPLTTPKIGVSSGAFWNPVENVSPVQKRPRHPPPMELPPKHDMGIQAEFNSALTPLESPLFDPNLDREALWRGLESTGIPFCVRKERRNEFTGLGNGLPSCLEEDTSRIPTVVPNPASGLYPATFEPHIVVFSNEEMDLQNVLAPARNMPRADAPILIPVEINDEDEMSPLALPEPVLAGIFPPEEQLLLHYTHGGDYLDPTVSYPTILLSEAEWETHLDAMLLAELDV